LCTSPQIWNLTSFTMISNEFHNSAFGLHCSLTQLLTIAKSPHHEQCNFWGELLVQDNKPNNIQDKLVAECNT
jgi:hypothetical protein